VVSPFGADGFALLHGDVVLRSLRRRPEESTTF